MKESVVRSKALSELEKEKWLCWYPYRTRFRKEKDIFGVADAVCVRKNDVKFIQWTTSPHFATRKRKVQEFLRKHKVKLNIEVWAWNKKKRCFRKEYVSGR